MNTIRTIALRAAAALAAAGVAVLAMAAVAAAAVPLPQPAPGAAATPTQITAFHRYSPGPVAVTGTLTTAAGMPLAGQSVTFTESNRVLCTAVTDAKGLAACTVTMGQIAQTDRDGGIFWSRFAGTVTLGPSLHAGHI